VKNTTKAKLQNGETVVGTFVFLGDPAIVEIAAIAGLDFVIVDAEHSPRDSSEIEAMIRAADARGITALVRVSGLNEKEILRALESGAHGIVLPQLESGEQAAQAVAAMRYPPYGTRSSCRQTRAAEYGRWAADFATHADEADREVLIVGLIETEAGLKNLDEIIEAGIEVAFLGRSDLASSMGLRGDVTHPRLERVAKQFVADVETHQCWPGIVPYQGAGDWATLGCPFIVLGTDVNVMLAGFRKLAGRLRGSVPAS
jgi:4-hydroxy-2-oxoheptanedioate aldolase